jgi:hypothetical protein
MDSHAFCSQYGTAGIGGIVAFVWGKVKKENN